MSDESMSPDGSLNSGAEDSGSEAGSWSHDEELDDKEQSGGVFGCADYTVYTPAAVESLMQERVAEVANIFALDTATSLGLLLQHNFSVEKVTASLLANRSKTLALVGVTDSPIDPKVKKAKPASLDCSICFSSVPVAESLGLQCGHVFCRECWAEHLRAKLDEGGHNAALARCPWQGCKCVVPAAIWEEFLSAKELARYRSILREEFALSWKDWKHCPKDDCHNIVNWHGKINTPVSCLCTFRWCYACQDEKIGDHAPATCEEVAAWLKKFSSESENLLYIRANTRMCPKCRSSIEKNGGCMHMTCRKCRHEFCWICFADWKGHSACNSKKPEIEKQAQAAASAKTELERMEHYMHRWESHKKAAEIARVDMANLFDLESYYVASFSVRTNDADFLRPTLNMLNSGRLILAWSYIREYYSDTKRISEVEKNMWSFGLSELEVHVDRLQEWYEKGKSIATGDVQEFLRWKQETVNLVRVAQQYFDGFVSGALKGTLVSAQHHEVDEPLSEAERFYSVQLETLAAMGFTDRKRLVQLLEENKGDANLVVEKLL